jgi:hypothetical protein
MSSVNNCKTSIHVAILSETHLKPSEKFFIPNYHFYRADSFPGRKGGTAVAVRSGIPHNHIDLTPFVSIEANRYFENVANFKLSGNNYNK